MTCKGGSREPRSRARRLASDVPEDVFDRLQPLLFASLKLFLCYLQSVVDDSAHFVFTRLCSILRNSQLEALRRALLQAHWHEATGMKQLARSNWHLRPQAANHPQGILSDALVRQRLSDAGAARDFDFSGEMRRCGLYAAMCR